LGVGLNLKLPILTDPSDTFQRDVRNALDALARAIVPPVEAVAAAPAVDIDVFTDTEDGLAPASGGGSSNFLRADGTWASPPSSGEANTASNVGAGADVFKQKDGVDLEFRTLVGAGDIGITENANDVTIDYTGPDLTGVGLCFFGTGIDGDVDFDGSATVLGHAPTPGFTLLKAAASPITFYALTRDIYCNNMSVASGVIVYSTGYRIFVKGTLTGPAGSFVGICGGDGGDGTAGAGGAASGAIALGTIAGRVAGGVGANPLGAAGGGGTSATAPPGFSNAGGNAGTAPNGAGGDGGPGKGGGGGGGGAVGNGSPAGAVTVVGVNNGSPDNISQAMSGMLHRATTSFSCGSGGGGGRGVNSGSGGGGGGASGGGYTFVSAREITGAIVITAAGGQGGAAYQGGITAGQGCAGGGGGGGGVAAVVIGTGNFPTVSVIGGIGGLPNPAGGGVGGAGGDGIAYLYKVGV
jgi:hypothetical protein